MMPERTAGLVRRWVRLYTRKLPAPVAERRIEEIDADLYDHITHERALGTADRRIGVGIVSRMVRGLPADLSWRGEHARAAEESMSTGSALSRSIIRVALGTAAVLMLPLLAMQFSDAVVWTLGDFVVAGTMLAVTGVMFEIAIRRSRNPAYRAAVAVALGSGLFLVWAILAVGAIGAEGDPFDLLYLGVLALGLGGAVAARLDADGMARALLTMAVGQGLVGLLALIMGKHEAAASSLLEVVGVTGLFVALFVTAAWLFRRAAREPRSASGAPI